MVFKRSTFWFKNIRSQKAKILNKIKVAGDKKARKYGITSGWVLVPLRITPRTFSLLSRVLKKKTTKRKRFKAYLFSVFRYKNVVYGWVLIWRIKTLSQFAYLLYCLNRM